MSKHTSGQWTWNGNNDNGVNSKNEFLIVTENTCIAKIPHMGSSKIVTTTTGEAEANAKLIAAAPELLEALETLSKWVILNSDAIPSELIYAKVAIAKAKI